MPFLSMKGQIPKFTNLSQLPFFAGKITIEQKKRGLPNLDAWGDSWYISICIVLSV